VRYRLSSLLALMVCAMTPSGHDSITAAAEWCRRATPEQLAAFGLPYHPLLGRYRVPSEKTLRSVLGRLDPGEIGAAGYDYLRPLLSAQPRRPEPVMPGGGPEREQRRAHRCLRGARRPDGSRVLSCPPSVTATVSLSPPARSARRPTKCPSSHLSSTRSTTRISRGWSLPPMPCTPNATTPPTSERGAHHLLTIKNNQRGQARQLHALPWKEIPVIHRDDARGHGRHEQRLVQVVTVEGLLFPHTAQILRIQRRRRLYGAKKMVQRDRLRHHRPARRGSERSRDRVLGSRALDRGKYRPLVSRCHLQRGQVPGQDPQRARRTRYPPRPDPQRARLAGYVNTAAGRRAHAERPRVLTLYGIT
jgi:hypothetical protein